MKNKHRLLVRQLKKFCPNGEEIPEEWRRLFEAINAAYEASDEDRRLMEKSMDISSREMFQVNQDLRQKEAALREALLRLQQTQQQLIQSEKLASIGQLAAGVAHEINNPLSFVSANVQVLERYLEDFGRIFAYLDKNRHVDTADAESAAGYIQELNKLQDEIDIDGITRDLGELLEETRDGLERVKRIVHDLRTFAREDKGERETVRLDKVIDRALSIASNEVKYRAEVVKDYAADLPPVRCSEQRLGQVFVNLIVNAAQAMADRGTIAIRTYLDEDRVCAEVADTGQGISQGDLLRIFDPFFTTKPVGMGTGLGLSVCHEIIKNYEGDITVTSEVNKGTTFLVKLPAGEET
ncbi:MAG: histidine kinase [Candidatus Omnitrophica bacterium]|nr:histidine kinase [Candidatus Omnitrophota bacterium]MCB9719973.1 histidine kinase [Candidatus Omnitrophota bacterium]